MPIRCESKAMIVNHGCVLLNRCHHENGDVYYNLPGGGQNAYESMEQALIREVKEETGYSVRVLRFAAITEEIYTSPEQQKAYPNHTHRMLHIFIAELVDDNPDLPSEKDYLMDDCVWVPLNDVAMLPALYPAGLQARFTDVLDSPHPVYLGTEYVHRDEA